MDDTVAMFVTILVAMVLTASLIAMWIRHRRPAITGDNSEAARHVEALRAENERLSERIAVLERIATDPAQRTAAAIEELRQVN